MPTILRTLDQTPDDHAMLHDLYRGGPFLHGECYAFAIALTQGLGWPMVGLIKSHDDRLNKNDLIWHAGVRAPDGRILDVRGLLPEDEFGGYFLSISDSMIREITEDELYAIRPIDAYTITKARNLAEVLWPDLPWIESRAMKAKAFADELEALSRKYGLWIVGGVPADPPRLFTGEGDEGGYDVRPTLDGLGYTINRHLPSLSAL